MEKILVLDFGGQYNQLIARRVRDHNVYAEILPYTTPIDEIKSKNYKGIIFTGGPNSVFDMSSPILPTFSIWAFLCSASATVASSSLGWQRARLKPHPFRSTARLISMC